MCCCIAKSEKYRSRVYMSQSQYLWFQSLFVKVSHPARRRCHPTSYKNHLPCKQFTHVLSLYFISGSNMYRGFRLTTKNKKTKYQPWTQVNLPLRSTQAGKTRERGQHSTRELSEGPEQRLQAYIQRQPRYSTPAKLLTWVGSDQDTTHSLADEEDGESRDDCRILARSVATNRFLAGGVSATARLLQSLSQTKMLIPRTLIHGRYSLHSTARQLETEEYNHNDGGCPLPRRDRT
ncbi:hypothetical protein E1B28_003748 [Marasmius oreades]|uniref:Uncharacterized protein n=1 Tax=Marasmius oreades TaxID=181124 RepID=A0A9P7UX66_9AGAR|nr:uncharacterized protein E1B28_003748 [Marasmius oreades]KAG7096302.1 hypothetical protein E1B28_003748 [Marasmius oreades]